MRSHNQQLDIFDHDPRLTAPKLAKAYRAAADEALKQFQFSAAVRQERHDYYLGEAKRHDAIAKEAKRAGRRRGTRKKALR
ncbi:hypothetical protein [Stenotrophomonas sp. VV52]|uniref:hypothetical protein n=1 Tax=Stenotrophomonas sp. VV52 TaxID=2066958 RepID=UPI000C9E21D7|nr:hypothetical protein [Stenotrophomonas sp. VV52]